MRVAKAAVLVAVMALILFAITTCGSVSPTKGTRCVMDESVLDNCQL